jgi:hypothetical protein
METTTKFTDDNTTTKTTEAQAIYLDLVAIQSEIQNLRARLYDRAFDHLQSNAEFWRANDRKIAGRKVAWKNRVRKIAALDGKFDRDFFKSLGGDKN